ncbi:hypothetical protein ACVWW1_002385 [Bradyrhizobium sp. JR3.5]
MQRAVLHFKQMADLLAAAIGRQPHQLAALVPVAEHIGRDPAVQRAETRHVVELVRQETARRLHKDLLQAFELCIVEPVVTLGLAGERRCPILRIGFHRVGLIVADAVDDHHDAVPERRHRERAIGMREVMRDRHHLVGLRAKQRMLDRLVPLGDRQEARHVLVEHPLLHLGHRQDVAVAHHQIDVVERDALGGQAVVDDFLVEAGGVLLAGDALLGDRIGDRAVTEQAGAHVMVVDVETKDVGVLFRHGHSSGRILKRSENMIVSTSSSRRHFPRLANLCFCDAQITSAQCKMNRMNGG